MSEPDVDAAMMSSPFTLLTTDEFVAELTKTLAYATADIEVQLMTFDGDASGLAIAGELAAAAQRGVRVRLLVDCFAHRFVSDRPVARAGVRAEYQRTLLMFDELSAAGVEVRYTNPNGPLNLFALARNHKKLYVIDDVTYLGGVNVSDHNFEWHDFMVRIDDPGIRRAVRADFEHTFAGRRVTTDDVIVTNRAIESTFDTMLAGATERVIVASPYALDRQLVNRLEGSQAASRMVVVADYNNFRFLQAITPYLARRLRRSGVELRRYQRFSHCKFVLVDDDQLLIGSSNYGRHSFWCNQEIGLVIRDRAFIAAAEKLLTAELVSVEVEGSRLLHAFGWVASTGMDWFLRLYARVVAERVNPLDGRRADTVR